MNESYEDHARALLMFLALSLAVNVYLGIRVIDYRQGRRTEARP